MAIASLAHGEVDPEIYQDQLLTAQEKRRLAYARESDPLFFSSQDSRDPHSYGEWMSKVSEIKQRYPLPPNGPVELSDLIKKRLNESSNQAELVLRGLTSSYPESEVISFERQEREARGYPDSPTPFLSRLAQTRGVPLESLISKVIEKADALAYVSADIIGQRQKLEDLIERAETEEELSSIAIRYNVPDGG